jgi:PAS domain S-box-containing protein
MARILVVDDEESIVYTFGSFLSDEGHEVLSARSYEEALERLSGTDVDLVFSDILLGARSGIDVLREVKARGLECPVVMITGYPEVRTASEAVRLGAFDYVAKPVVQETLLRITSVALRHKRALDENGRYRSHLEAIFMSVDDAIITVDGEMNVLAVNEAAGGLCGLGPDAVGRNLADTELPCRERLLEALRGTLEGRPSARAHRLECGREGRSPLVLSVSTCLLRGRESRSLGAVMVVRDDTRLADLEQDLKERKRCHDLVGTSKAMQDVYSLVERLADVETSVLVTGESGTGKELVAEALHFLGPRGAGPLVKVNCSALPENLLESELFGHVRGAFTGAASDRIGRFQRADGGTILLDEIGDISPRMQSALLRVLQEKEFDRVGDSRPVRVDVRVIASTNKDLRDKVGRGAFREDLYYRLKVVEISLPPLRARREDIPLLSGHFVKKLNRKLNREIRGLSVDVEALFMEYAWPGNVRELEHALEHAAVLCREDTICRRHLPPGFGTLPPPRSADPLSSEGDAARTILQALRKTAWNKAKAARLLGIDRKTLYRQISKHGIPPEGTE